MHTTKKVAILGATSHIAKNIIFEFSKTSNYELCLYARSVGTVRSFLDRIEQTTNFNIRVYPMNEFGNYNVDVIINCIGIGNPAELKEDKFRIFSITEYYDNLIIDYLKNKSNDTLYINLSSGAAYGSEFDQPVNELTWANVEINNLTDQNYYGITKLYTEAKHRSLEKFNIVDLRVFSFFSKFIDLSAKFLISEIINCISNEKIFETSKSEILRDYVDPKDFCNLIKLCIDKHYTNDFYDVYSLGPTSKQEMMNMFHEQFGLKYVIKDDISISNSTGIKSNYYSLNKKAQKLQYVPIFYSLETIAEEARAILLNKRVIR
ncbi:NAD-dependent epimerase/dehydratase family protein [Paenibacillus sp. FSL H7-0331]|uniref:NAD-dependent epimerase/dehydratase family protein n=1 Tax=Paenibacillus sp. FSL H7-0331 TaxID=1920421 RepID=UPI00096D4ECA|nr:NAD-dependent epimerase/dehydratase family protein [Paenibacillus sp. FSL H7-0331]OMF08587.1 hypothetical protein BK127_28365 [Paenibacillus sp. FSL H7-0331]